MCPKFDIYVFFYIHVHVNYTQMLWFDVLTCFVW